MLKKLILYHIIHITLFSTAFAQELNLDVVGNNKSETQTIDSIPYAKTHLDFQSIEAEVDSVYHKILNKGFLEARIRSTEKTTDSTVLATFFLGNQYETISIAFDNMYIEKRVIAPFTSEITGSHFTIPVSKAEQVLKHLNQTIAEQGLPFATLKLTHISPDPDNHRDGKQLSATLQITPNGRQRQIDDIVLKGYETFPKGFLKHYLKLKRGKTFSLKAIKDKTQLLDNLRFAGQTKPPEVLFTNDSTTLYLYFEKTKSNTFDGFLGFGTNEDTNRLEFDGYLNLSLINNLNFGERFALLYKSDENRQRTFDASLQLPYLFASPVGAEFQLNIFKKDSLFTTVGQAARLTYRPSAKHNFKAGLKFMESSNLQDAPDASNGTSSITTAVTDFKTLLYTMGYQFENRESKVGLFPVKTSVEAEIGLGKRSFETLPTGQAGIAENQTHLNFDAFNIFNLNDKNSVFLRLNGAGIDSNTYLENELVRFGGINSIRGFEENSLTASWFGLANLEYRYLLSPSMYAHTITDVGYFENHTTNQNQKLYGFGFGFGILTKAGLFRLVYANGKSKNQRFKLSNSKIHLSLTAFF